MVEGDRLEIYCRLCLPWVRIPPSPLICGEVTEWLKVHDWKSCLLNCNAGSNPALSEFLWVVACGSDGRVL